MAEQAIVERSCTKLRSAIGDEATDSTGDLQEMLDTLEAIQAAMLDTERLSDGFKSESGKECVKKVRIAAYGVSDLVDEFKLQRARTPAAGKMTNRVELPENKMPEKMKEIKKLLEEALKESVEFHVKNRASNPITVPPGAPVGRDEDKEGIFAHLSARCPSEEPIILLIAGEEGVGKTTVAEMVFNDVRFRCYSRVWVNRSYELHEIGNSIISQLSGKEEMRHASEDDVDSITDRLHELLNGMKVLIVLDDLIMCYFEWEPLKRMFSVDELLKGSQVIVVATTRYPRPEKDSVIQSYNLDLLSVDMCCTIIKQLAGGFEDRSAKKDLEQIAPEIAQLCGGSPLAAQLFGSLLKFKHYEEWPTLMDKSRWPEDPVDLSLELCYRSMPPNLRLCFAYIPISDVPRHQIFFKKEDLIHQWIALGLIEPSDGTSSDIELAEEYITRLLSMSFLQTVHLPQASGKDDTGAILFDMHRSILDYGRDQVQDDLVEVYYPEDCSVTEHCRYVLIDECDAWPDSLLPDQKIRAINCSRCNKMDLSDDSSVPTCLRVLILDNTAIQRLPHSISQLEQLGYLNLSDCSRLVGLPDIFGNLKNLLHINLSGCSELVNLPDSFVKLKFLRYINLSGCSRLETLPKSFGKLINLVHVDLSGCCALKNPQGFFGQVTLPGSFGKLIKLVHINLSNCSGLEKLPQSFGKLTSLKHINLSGCSGLVTLPKSFGDLRNLLHIDLSRCYGLSKLPETFGKLTSLQQINLSGCSRLETLPESFGGLTNLLRIDLSHCCGLPKLPESFKKLKKLVYLDLSFWSCFDGIQIALGGLTSLQHLNLSHPCCYRADHSYLEELKGGFGNLSKLQYLNLSMLLNPLSYSQSEKENLEDIGFLLKQYIGCISSLHSLEYLDLSHNIFLRDLPDLSVFRRLHTLDLSGCIRLKELGTWITKMESLKSIILRDCEGLESYKFEVGVNNIINYVQLQDVTSKELEITCLEKMNCLEEARRIKLAGKLKLQTLKLCWTPVKSVEENKLNSPVDEIEEHEVSVGKNRPDSSVKEIEEHDVSVEKKRPDSSAEEIKEDEVSVDENVLLGELKPPQNLKYLELHGYRGEICHPSWLSEEICSADLLNLVEVTMQDFASCKTLPPFGLLPNLQRLVVRRMARVRRIDVGDLIGSSRPVKCTIDDMPSLEEFNTTYNSGDVKFTTPSAIHELVILLHKCPCLRFGTLPPRFRRLEISECDQGMTSIGERQETYEEEGPCELVVKSCSMPIYQWSLFDHLSVIHSLTIENCSLHALLGDDCDDGNSLPEYMAHLATLQELKIVSCNGVKHLRRIIQKLTSLESLHLSDCKDLDELPESIQKVTSLKSLHLSDCQDLSELPKIIQKLASLESLHIIDCHDLSELPEIIQKVTSLKSLHLRNCQYLRELPQVLGDLTSLEVLCIDRCSRVESLPESISKLKNLKNLYILECPSLKRWCEDKKNKKHLGHVRPEYESPNTSSKPGEQPKRS